MARKVEELARKADELRPVMVRLPEKLRLRLERAASVNGRSMNTEIIHRLEVSFAGGRPVTVAQLKAQLDRALPPDLRRLLLRAEKKEEDKS
jgi:hypothetical protein